ncbi:MAG: C-terminal target protein, partial [Mucilaginibacter sp.]|nr:C-terminal target protein [Mucilaginibacter sp.]
MKADFICRFYAQKGDMYEKNFYRKAKWSFGLKYLKKILSVSFILFFFLTFFTLNVNAQTPGLIYKPASTVAGKHVLNPSGNGYTSATTAGFQGGVDDGVQSELKMTPIVEVTSEPASDLTTGASGGQTDIVGFSKSVYVLNDGTNLIIRFRIGKNSSASKGYCLLIDNNGQFGPTDPSYISNPADMGFELSVTLETNFRVRVRNLVTGAVINDYASGTQEQRSIAATALPAGSGNTNVFYDFYVPLSDLTTNPATASFRFAATTITSGQSDFPSGTVSDINGIADNSYSGNTFAAFSTAITSFPPTILSTMTTGFTFSSPVTSAPFISSSLLTSSNSITGTSAEADGTTITIYKDGVSMGTATVTANAWTLSSGVSGVIAAGNAITAKATAVGHTISAASNSVIVGQVCTTPPTITGIVNGSKGYVGTWTALPGQTTTATSVQIFIHGISSVTTTINSQNFVAGQEFTISTDYQGNAVYAPAITTAGGTSAAWSFQLFNTGNSVPAGTFWATAQNVTAGTCVSNPSNFQYRTISATATPVITTSPVYDTGTSVSGTKVANSKIYLYINGVERQITTADATTSWTVTGLNLVAGDVITAAAIIDATSGLSALSNAVTVQNLLSGTSVAPVITGTYNNSQTSVLGTSLEAAGTTITVYKNSISIGTTTVNIFGNWTLTGITLATNDLLKATASAANKNTSGFSNVVTVLGASASVPTVTGPILAGATSISGTGANGTLTIYVDGSPLSPALTSQSGAWTYSTTNLPGLANELYKGAVVTATNTETGKLEGTKSAGVTVQGADHFLVEANGGGNIGIQTAGVAFTIQISARNVAPGSTLFNTYTSTNVVSSASTVIGGGGPTGAFTLGALTGWNMTLTTAGTYTLTTLSTDDPTLVGTSNSFVVLPNPGPANKLAINTQPSTTVLSQVTLAQQPVIYIQDQYGNTVTTDNTTTVTVSLASGTGTLNGQLTVTAVNGVATFTGLSITSASTANFTLGFSSTPGYTGVTSGIIAVTTNSPAAPASLSYSSPQIYTVNNAITSLNPTVTGGSPTTYSISPGLPAGLSINVGTGVISGTPTVSAASAVYTVTASNGTGNKTFGITITVNSLAATKLAITTQPSSAAQSGIAFTQQPVIQLQDGSSNPISQAGINVTAAIITGAGTLAGTVTVQTNSSGVATFTDLNISGLIGVRTLQFTSSGLTSVNSGNITLGAGAATAVRVETAADGTGSVVSAQNLTSGNTITGYSITRDAAGNFVANAAGTWSLTNKTLGVATGNLVAAVDTKSAVMTGVLTGTANISATSTGLTATTSGTVTVIAGAAAKLAISIQPSSSILTGVTFAQQPVILVQDVAGNTVNQAGISISSSIASGAGTLGGTLSIATDGSGVGTFSDLMITGANGNRTLQFSSAGLTGVTSATIAVTAVIVTISTQTNITTFGASTGAVTVAGSGGTSPYQYKIGSGTLQSSPTFTGLAAGTYTITVQDNNSNNSTVSVTITQPSSALAVTISTQTNITTFGASTG